MTPTDELLGDLRERMVRIETKIDVQAETHKTLRADHEALHARVDTQDIRLTKLESLQRMIVAIGAVIAFVLTFFQDWLTSHLS